LDDIVGRQKLHDKSGTICRLSVVGITFSLTNENMRSSYVGLLMM